MRVVVLAKQKPGLDQALQYLQSNSVDFAVCTGSRFDPFPSELYEAPVDYTISYLSPWIVPETVLKKARVAAVNFHPGPPEYPGTGCTNFAIYDQVSEYGVTAHIMQQVVDSGKILMVSRFSVTADQTLFEITHKCYQEIARIFPIVMNSPLFDKHLPACSEKWTRQAFTRKELDKLCMLDLNMSRDEVNRRIRATSYPAMPGAFLEFFGYGFELKQDEKK